MPELAMGVSTYKANAKLHSPALQSFTAEEQTANQPSFVDFVSGKVGDAIKAGRTAETAVNKFHSGDISQIDLNMILEEVKIQMAELRSMTQSLISATQEALKIMG